VKLFGLRVAVGAVGLLFLSQSLEAQMRASKAAPKNEQAKIQNATSAAPTTGDLPPHLMIFWSGTPYEHLMVPVK